jgi:hypothetical protein
VAVAFLLHGKVLLVGVSLVAFARLIIHHMWFEILH